MNVCSLKFTLWTRVFSKQGRGSSLPPASDNLYIECFPKVVTACAGSTLCARSSAVAGGSGYKLGARHFLGTVGAPAATEQHKHDRNQEYHRIFPALLRRRTWQAQKDEAQEVRVAHHEGHPVLQLPVLRPPRLLGPRSPRLREHHGAQHRLLHPRYGLPVHRHHLRVCQASGDGAGDRAGARAHLRPRKGLLQEDSIVLHVQ